MLFGVSMFGVSRYEDVSTAKIFSIVEIKVQEADSLLASLQVPRARIFK